MTDTADTRPDLAPAVSVGPRDLEPQEHWIWRESPQGRYGDWYRIVQMMWKPRANNYYVQIDRPEGLANVLANHFYLQPRQRVSVRRPHTPTTESVNTESGEPSTEQEGPAAGRERRVGRGYGAGRNQPQPAHRLGSRDP